MVRRCDGTFVPEACIALVCIAAFYMWSDIARLGAPSKEQFTQPGFTGIDYERLYAVSTAFRRVLERPPTEAELQLYENKLSLDPEFDVPALEVYLRQTAEYKRLVGMQKNSSFAEIDGVVSEQAIRGKLADMYFRITGQKADDVTMELLYSRYRHTNLSDAYITALIQQMADVSGTGGPGGVDSATRTSSSAALSGSGGNGSAGGNGDEGSAVNADAITDGDSVTIEKAWLRSLGLTEDDLKGDPQAILEQIKKLSESCKATDVAEDRYKKMQLCKRERQRMLDSIGYDEGALVGSWTMPHSRDEHLFDEARRDQSGLRASQETSSLVGSLLPT